jgi:hypothetical protein|tara:strand:- start:171 stop:401 length:231 start_codon:yes stop_codon:yes gene_type:complete
MWPHSFEAAYASRNSMQIQITQVRSTTPRGNFSFCTHRAHYWRNAPLPFGAVHKFSRIKDIAEASKAEYAGSCCAF